MSKTKYSKPPLTQAEKEKRANDFVNLSDDKGIPVETKAKAKAKKEPVKSIFIRAPKSYWDDIQEIINLTGLTMNSICLELLRPALKRKLKELKEE